MNNYYFTTASTFLVVIVGWILTDKFIEPRLKATQVDGDPADMPKMDDLKPNERKGLRWASFSMLLSVALLIVSALPETSAWRGTDGSLTHSTANLMQSIVGLIFVLFLFYFYILKTRIVH